MIQQAIFKRLIEIGKDDELLGWTGVYTGDIDKIAWNFENLLYLTGWLDEDEQ